MSEAVMIVTITLKPGASRERFLELCREIKALLERQAGFVRYALFEGADGRWTDVMTWASTDAMNAGNQVLSDHSGAFEDLVEKGYTSFFGEVAPL